MNGKNVVNPFLNYHILKCITEIMKCELYDKSFTRTSTVKTLQKIHAEEKPYKCKDCEGQIFHLEFILETELAYVKNRVNLLLSAQLLEDIRKFILGRKMPL